MVGAQGTHCVVGGAWTDNVACLLVGVCGDVEVATRAGVTVPLNCVPGVLSRVEAVCNNLFQMALSSATVYHLHFLIPTMVVSLGHLCF